MLLNFLSLKEVITDFQSWDKKATATVKALPFLLLPIISR
jgi:hypothetical protein